MFPKLPVGSIPFPVPKMSIRIGVPPAGVAHVAVETGGLGGVEAVGFNRTTVNLAMGSRSKLVIEVPDVAPARLKMFLSDNSLDSCPDPVMINGVEPETGDGLPEIM